MASLLTIAEVVERTGLTAYTLRYYERAGLRSEGAVTAPARREMLEQHLAQVLASIDAMQHAAQALHAKIEHYRDLETPLRYAPEPRKENSHDPRHQSPLPPRPGKAARNRRPGG